MSPSAPPSPTSSTSSLSTPLDPVASMMGAGDDDASSPGLHDTLAPPRELKAKGVTPITFDGQLTRTLRYHEDVRNGCGGQTWPAGMVLGKHLLRYHREELKDARM